MAIVAAVLLLAIGFLLVRALWPRELLAGTLALRCCLAWGVGAGATTLLFFAGLLLLGEAKTWWVCGSEVAALTVLLAANRQHAAAAVRETGTTPASPRERVRTAAIALAVLAAAASFVLATLANPHGVGDALTIWNLRAHMLFGSGREWQQVFVLETPELAGTHPDYPLLLPLVAVRSWHWLGESRAAVPASVAFVFTFGTGGLLWAGLRRLRGGLAGCLAAAALLAFPAFAAAGATQFADVPLAYFFAAALVVLAVHDEAPAARSLLVLAGLLLGLGAWTKNEGILFALVVPAVRTVAHRARGWRACRGEWLALALGALPVLAALAVFKLALVPPNDLVEQVLAGNVWHRVFDGARWLEIARALGIALWSLGPPMLAATIVWAWCCPRDRLRLPLLVAAVMLAAYCATYLCASRNLAWHLATSMQRLLLQLLPAVVLGVFAGRPRGVTSSSPPSSPPSS